MSGNVLIMLDKVIMLVNWIGLLIQARCEKRCRGFSCLMWPSHTKGARLTWCFLSTSISIYSTYHSTWGPPSTADTTSILNGPLETSWSGAPPFHHIYKLPNGCMSPHWPCNCTIDLLTCTVWNLEYIFIRFNFVPPLPPRVVISYCISHP